MSARDDILAGVRAALQGVSDADRHAALPASPRLAAREPGEWVALFAERVADYRAEVVRCGASEVAATVAAVLGERRAVVPQGLSFDVAGAVVDAAGEAGGLDGTGGLDAGELDRLDAVVTEAALGIAETGTIVLDHGPGQGRRVISLVPDVHVCVVRADQVVPDVPDALVRLDPRRPQTWISGPSATSDIELDRVEGVHGPRTLVVVLAG